MEILMKPYPEKDYYLGINQLYTIDNKRIDHFHYRIIFSLFSNLFYIFFNLKMDFIYFDGKMQGNSYSIVYLQINTTVVFT